MVTVPSRDPAEILADIHALRSARASGVLEVKTDDRHVKYQSIAAMDRAESRLLDEYAQATGQAQSSISLARFTRN